MNKKLKLGILGGGGDSLIGILHRVASQMYDQYQVIGGCFNVDYDVCRSFGQELGLDENRVYRDLDHLIESEMALPQDQRIEVVSVLTPNFLHYPMAKKLIENGIHVICEKPLTTNYEDAVSLRELAQKHKVVFAVT